MQVRKSKSRCLYLFFLSSDCKLPINESWSNTCCLLLWACWFKPCSVPPQYNYVTVLTCTNCALTLCGCHCCCHCHSCLSGLCSLPLKQTYNCHWHLCYLRSQSMIGLYSYVLGYVRN